MASITPPSSYAFGSPQIGVEVWPHIGGPLVFNGGNSGVLEAEIEKDIRDKRGGKFYVHIAPGGPNGVNDPVSWTNILVPGALVIIYLNRSGSRRIVMIGILVDVAEDQIWNNKEVIRTIKLRGFDFTYYFNAFNYYTLAYLGFIPLDPGAAAAWQIGRFGKSFQGTPDAVALDWL